MTPKPLGAAFTRRVSDATHTLIERVEEYDVSLPGLANAFAQMMSSICLQRPDVVYSRAVASICKVSSRRC